jgi:hypothetical protein
LPQKAALL